MKSQDLMRRESPWTAGTSERLSSISRAQKRGNSEPAEHNRESRGEGQVPGSILVRVICRILADQGDQTHSREGQENKAGYLMPELPEDTAEMA